jgi:hypothetical protein
LLEKRARLPLANGQVGWRRRTIIQMGVLRSDLTPYRRLGLDLLPRR